MQLPEKGVQAGVCVDYHKPMSEEPITVNIRRYEDLIQNKIKVCLLSVKLTK